jgi:tRNA threonylcarbamoyladenosine biosynthesis protein TsaB
MSKRVKSEPFILSVETATLSGSVAVSRGAEILAGSVGDSAISHSNTLLNDIDKLLSKTGITLSDIELFAVALGPGSFTGLRIGIATVKALAATMAHPCVGVPTLKAIALAAGESVRSVALLPAGRGEVFAQSFSVSREGLVIVLDEASHISPHNLLERYGSLSHVLWCGEGAKIHREMIEGWAEQQSARDDVGPVKGWRFAPQTFNLANYVAYLAYDEFERDQCLEPQALQAIYVRPSDAELKA